jgi:hypothetical protein
VSQRRWLPQSWHPYLQGLRRSSSYGPKSIVISQTWSELAEAITFMSSGPEEPPDFPFVSELIICRPQARDETNRSCASIFRMHRPVLSSQMRIVWSSAAERRYLPLG